MSAPERRLLWLAKQELVIRVFEAVVVKGKTVFEVALVNDLSMKVARGYIANLNAEFNKRYSDRVSFPREDDETIGRVYVVGGLKPKDIEQPFLMHMESRRTKHRWPHVIEEMRLDSGIYAHLIDLYRLDLRNGKV